MNIQSLMKTIGDNGCLALSYLHMIGVTDLDKIPVIARAIDEGTLGPDCLVRNADKLLELGNWFNKYVFNRPCANPYIKLTVTKVTKYDKNLPVIANYEYNGKNHFVIVNGKTKEVLYNTLDKSNCVENGKITSYRIIEGIN